ncbi:MAG: dephospho-CoA kinase [Bacteroidetes bacterium]|nr:dephospho-CoA kinase [Bacteroidota bacterium]
MLRVGLTGGIGSGKTTVAQIFESLGIPVFYADDVAKQLMAQNPALITAIKEEFGQQAYLGDLLNKAHIASVVFSNPQKLNWLNQLVHPATIQAANNWFEEQKSAYAIIEAALLFESGADKGLDYTVGVSSPLALRLERVIKRDGSSPAVIKQRMDNQLDEEIRDSKCDFLLFNNNTKPLLAQVIELDKQLRVISNEKAQG